MPEAGSAVSLDGRLVRRLQDLLGPDAVLTQPARLLPYESDAMPLYRARPAAVLLPEDSAGASGAARLLHEAGVSWVPRGAGTGLSGGAIAGEGQVVIGLARLRRILEVDPRARQARVEAGVPNLELNRAVARHGLMFAPDPSSQVTCTVGGNVANNAGGPHTLRHGVTAQHLLSVRLVLGDGTLLDLGGATETMAGYDLLSLLCGSEGTFALITEATVRLMPLPEATRTFLAAFDDVAAASRSVTALLRAGVVPAALEMIDSGVLAALEEAFHAGLPRDAGAVVIGDAEGLADCVDGQLEAIADLLRANGAREVRIARGERDRLALWSARKKAFGALGRIAPNYLSHDAVIPRSALPQVLQEIARIGRDHRLRIANVFHAGDGNLHPAILFDEAEPELLARTYAAGDEILRACLAAGGVLTGEHGVGIAKRERLRWVYTEYEIGLLAQLRRIFDPWGRVNPGKVLPPAAGEDPVAGPPAAGTRAADTAGSAAQGPGDRGEEGALVSAPQPMRPVPLAGRRVPSPAARLPEGAESVLCERIAQAGERWETLIPIGAGTLTVAPPPGEALSLHEMDRILEQDPADMTVTVEPGVVLALLEQHLAGHGQMLAWEAPQPARATIGGVVAAGYWSSRTLALGHPKHSLLGFRAVTGRGEVIAHGARVVKNVTGYDLCRLQVGSRGTLGALTRLILRTYPLPERRAAAILEAPFSDLLALAAQLAALPVGWSALDLYAGAEGAALRVGLDGTAAEVERRWRELQSLLPATLDRGAGSGSGDPVSPTNRGLRRVEGEAERTLRARVADWLRWDDAELVIRLVVSPQHAVALAARVHELCLGGPSERKSPAPWSARMECHPAVGLVRLAFGARFDEPALRRLWLTLADEVREARGYRALDRAPEDLWWGWDPWGTPRGLSERLRRIKLAFDPRGVLAPWMIEGWTRGV